jgi:regulatory protein YycH of two-component signal transduction system YycFG
MKFETIKSILLTVLVLLSFGLTWVLWTYQPQLDPLVSGKLVEEVEMGDKKEVPSIIKPDRILYHEKDQHYGTTEVDKVMKEMSDWVFFDVENFTEQSGDFKQAVHGPGKVELVFPHEVPIELFRNVLEFEEKRIPSFQFDRIVIDMTSMKRDRGRVYFANVTNQQIYVSYISTSFLKQFNEEFVKNADQYSSYFAYNAGAKRRIFLPEHETEMMQYKYLPMNLNSESFKKALFKDPNLVLKSFVGNGEEFTDDSSKMNIYTNDNYLVFVNPSEDNGYISGAATLLKRSIDFINQHSGWTDPYRFASLDESGQEVTFRMYSMDGYPVFNSKGLSEIYEAWGRNEITKFTRPTFSMELPLEFTKVLRPSGKDVIEYLESKDNFKPEMLESLVLGYRMERDPQSQRLIILEPAWFYLYNNSWEEISTDELGGIKRGLE